MMENKVCDTCKWGKYLKNGGECCQCNGCKDGSGWEPKDSCNVIDGIRHKVPAFCVVDSGNRCEREPSESRIADSGNRREFSTGAVRDMAGGKGRMDLLPWTAIMEVSKHCERGAVKYGEHNVDKGIPVHSFIDSAARHLGKYIEGWEDEPHLVAAAWNLLWAIQMEIKKPELKDVPWKEEVK